MYVGAAGCYLEDAHGNRLFDANAGLWCVNIGYGREEIVEAIREQAGRMSYGQIFGRDRRSGPTGSQQSLLQHGGLDRQRDGGADRPPLLPASR